MRDDQKWVVLHGQLHLPSDAGEIQGHCHHRSRYSVVYIPRLVERIVLICESSCVDFPHGEATDGITCLPPLITQFDATKLSSAVRGKLNVSLSWRYTHDQSYPYCDGSRQFHVAYTQYTNYQEALNDKSYLYVNQEYKFVSRRVTNHTLYLLSVDNYFRFFIRTPEGLNSTRFNSAVVSKLKHFRNSGEQTPRPPPSLSLSTASISKP